MVVSFFTLDKGESTSMNKQCMCSRATGVCLALCLLLVAGCGQKGDLYFPKNQTAVSQPLQQT